jgi:hypothetical protein
MSYSYAFQEQRSFKQQYLEVCISSIKYATTSESCISIRKFRRRKISVKLIHYDQQQSWVILIQVELVSIEDVQNLVTNCSVLFVTMFSGNRLLVLPVKMLFVVDVFEHGATHRLRKE